VDTQVIVIGAGPVGLTAAIELRRRGVDVLIVDKRDSVAPWAKAVGIQPRTLEIWDQVGVVDA
jgi:2-polyprenyl-6-methoxyphenol hydroxylase-like FAD-dependent oxidoreductase